MIAYEISVSYDFDNGIDMEKDRKIEAILGDRNGSGAGFGSRDMTFDAEGPMSDEEIEALQKRLRDETGDQTICVAFDEFDDEDEE